MLKEHFDQFFGGRKGPWDRSSGPPLAPSLLLLIDSIAKVEQVNAKRYARPYTLTRVYAHCYDRKCPILLKCNLNHVYICS
jgi:hypothetical protein